MASCLTTKFIVRISLAIAALLAATSVSLGLSETEREISFYSVNTKETVTVVYKRNGEYVPEAMERINYIMRDWRRNLPTKMDPQLIDLIYDLHKQLGSKKPIHMISGFRSKKTNEKLRRRGGGQARRSQHILGKAADIHFPDVPVKLMRNSALVRELGGVGYYPTSSIPFIHVDTGRIRHWPRMGRHEIAALFPSGKSKHVPRGGRPITKKDHKVAMSRLSAAQKHLIRVARGEIPVRQPGASPTLVAGLDQAIAAKPSPLASPLPKKTPSPAKTVAVASDAQQKTTLASDWQTMDRGVAMPWGHSVQSKTPKRKSEGQLVLASADPLADLISRNSEIVIEGAPKPAAPEKWARAPEFDPEHPDELSYTPFPVLPLLNSKPVSYDMKVAELQAPDHAAAANLMSEPKATLPLSFRPGLQFAEMFWASEFKGRAVSSLLTGVPRGVDYSDRSKLKTARR